MNKEETFRDLLTNSNSIISPLNFGINLVIAFLLSLAIGYIFVKCGRSLSNRKSFSLNFTLISMTTMLVIAVVKSSLALSLGLVGALSIVRFRTALKEPEELAYIFLCIAVGLGLGANQTITTLLGVGIILIVIILRYKFSKRYSSKMMNLSISINNLSENDTSIIMETLNQYCETIDLKRFSQSKDNIETSFYLDLRSFDDLENIRKSLYNKFPNINLTFIDNSGLIIN